MSEHDAASAKTELELAKAFGREPAQWAVEALKAPQQHSSTSAMTVEEAGDVVLAASFGRETDRARIAEAQRVFEEQGAPPPATVRGTTEKAIDERLKAPMNDLLERVVSKPGGRTPGFSEDHDRRMDAAFAALHELAESRLGMPKRQAEDHARTAFLEMQHTASTRNETKETFVRRLEQRVAGYRAMSPLVIDG